jgi:penicillin-binding protein 1A
MTWKRFMAYAHSGIEIKPIPYVDQLPSSPTGAPLVAEGGAASPATDRPLSLSVRTSERLAELEKLLRSVPGVRGVPTASLGRSASIISIGAPAGGDDALPKR